VAAEIGGWDVNANVSSESDIQMLVDEVLRRYGQIDLFCSNAGVGVDGDCCAPDRDWLRSWEVNVMGHVYAARAVLPGMLARHEGYLLNTVSAAGLLTMLGSAPYTVSKHAALKPGRVAQHYLWRPGDQGFRAVPDGRKDPHAGARRIRRRHIPAGRCDAPRRSR
jgi:NAD(P)-dependent dehydrogenase (short-subunit alcohol dehydrogenase family)